jgi:hypothetical protein
MFKLPILILTYNRPEHLLKLIKKLKKIKPAKIYISCDGPKNNYDREKILKISRIINLIDTKTKVISNFLKKNKGIRLAPQCGISWFFKKEKMGIILEDDCIPTIFFFQYMKYLLLKYKNNRKIFAISGYNHLGKTNFGEASYFLSNYFLCWGWATWRRSWIAASKNLTSYLREKNFTSLKNKFENDIEFRYWKKTITNVYEGKTKTWDIQFMASMWKKNSFCLLPNVNMVNNIGFDDSSTTSPSLRFQVAKAFNWNGKIKDPKLLRLDKENELIIFNNLFRPKFFLYPFRIIFLLKIIFSQPKFFFRKTILQIRENFIRI